MQPPISDYQWNPRVARKCRRPAPIFGLELVRARSGRAEADDELTVAAGLLHATVLQDYKAGGRRVLRTLKARSGRDIGVSNGL